MDAIFSRRAVRSFKSCVVNEECLRSLIGSASMAPSAMNHQPWAFAVLTDRSLLKQISGMAARHVLSERVGGMPPELERSLRDEHFDMFYGAPAVIIVCATSRDPRAAEECAMAAQNLMLAACQFQLGSCCVGLPRRWLNSEEGRNLLGTPAHWRAIAPIAVGFALEHPAPPPRRAPDILWIEELEHIPALTN